MSRVRFCMDKVSIAGRRQALNVPLCRAWNAPRRQACAIRILSMRSRSSSKTFSLSRATQAKCIGNACYNSRRHNENSMSTRAGR